MSYLEDVQTYLHRIAGTPGVDLFVSPPVPHTKKRGQSVGIPEVATFVSQAPGAGEDVKRYKNQAATSTPNVQVVIRDLDYSDGHDRAVAVFRKLGPLMDPPPEHYIGHVLRQSAPDFQGVNPDGLFYWYIVFTIYLNYD